MKKIFLILLVTFCCTAQAQYRHADDADAVFSVYFDSGKDTPRKKGVQLMTVEVQGYTDNVGDSVYNMALSLRRAQHVASLLELSFADSLTTAGYGQLNPLYRMGSSSGSAYNRRVDIIIKKHLLDSYNACYRDLVLAGPNGEELVIPKGIYDSCDCNQIHADYNAVVNQEQLARSDILTNRAADNTFLYSGGMLQVKLNRGSCHRPCNGPQYLRLPKNVYNCRNKKLYTAKIKNDKIFWVLSPEKSFKDTLGYYEIELNCNETLVTINCNDTFPCLLQNCALSFNRLGLPDVDSNVVSTVNGITLQTSNKGFNIADINADEFYKTHRVTSTTADGMVARYNIGFYITGADSGEHIQKGRVYAVNTHKTSHAALALYKWNADTMNGTGAWIKKAGHPIDLEKNKYCQSFYYSVNDTGIYMLSDSVTDAGKPFNMLIDKRFKLLYGYTTSAAYKHNCPSICMPVSMAGKTLTIAGQPGNDALLICLFKKGNHRFVLEKRIKALPRNAEGIITINKSMLTPADGRDVNEALNDLAKKYCGPDKAGCGCYVF